MTPYYADDLVTLYHGDGRAASEVAGVVVTDPPYNIGYRYGAYRDRVTAEAYRELIAVTCRTPSVVVHYAEAQFEVAAALGRAPDKVVSWVYNTNLPRQWRAIAWYGIAPDLGRVRQPYKNRDDRRIAALIRGGSEGPAVYDWWHIDPVKNVSEEKTAHPCPMPLEVMTRIVAVTSAEVIVDPFAGSGTTLRAAKDLGRRAVGFEVDERYCEIAARRLSQDVLGLLA